MPVVTLPDGSQRRFDHPVTVDEVAGGIGAGLRKAPLGAPKRAAARRVVAPEAQPEASRQA